MDAFYYQNVNLWHLKKCNSNPMVIHCIPSDDCLIFYHQDKY